MCFRCHSASRRCLSHPALAVKLVQEDTIVSKTPLERDSSGGVPGSGSHIEVVSGRANYGLYLLELRL